MAYELRISDWSSDVCSSDLADGGGVWDQVDVARRGAGDVVAVLGIVAVDRLDEDVLGDAQAVLAHAFEELLGRQDLAAGDAGHVGDEALALVDTVLFQEGLEGRKSVVSGKCVSVWVDLGSRSIIKKKIKDDKRGII